MRTIFLVAFAAVAASGCGTVCDAAVAAEQSANQKGDPCNLNHITVHDANKCNSNINSKCTADDVSTIKTYTNCLNNLAVCTPETSSSFNLARFGCTTDPIGRLSASCAGGIL